MAQIVQGSFEYAGYQAHIRFYPWVRGYMEAQKGSLDGLFAVWMREERTTYFLYSDSILPSRIVVLVRQEDAHKVDGVSDLAKLRVGNVRKYALPPKLAGMSLTIDDGAFDDRNNIDRLLRKRVDAILIDQLAAEFILANCFVMSREQFVVKDILDYEEAQYFVVGVDHPHAGEIIAAFNRGYRKLLENNQQEAILRDMPTSSCQE